MTQGERLFIEEFRAVFHRSGLKATHSRLVIARHLAQSSRALTISEIVDGIVGEELDRTTVNRVLHVFASAGFVSLRKSSNRELLAEILHPLLVCQTGGPQF